MMKKLMTYLIISLIMVGCSSRIGKVEVINTDTSQVLVCDYDEVKETRDIKFSELMDSIRIIKFEDTPDAYFKCKWMYFSDNYIAVVQQIDDSPVLLFDKSGKFIAEVGAYGNGPGEYNTSIIDCILDEQNNVIYLLPFSGPKILKYDFNGKYIGEIKFPVSINKGKMSLQSDSTLLVFHLCFKDLNGQKFNVANIKLSNDSIRYFYTEELALNIKGDGGFNHEVWSYRSADGFPISVTYNNILYHFNPNENIVESAFVFNINKEAHKDDLKYYILNEIPGYYLVYMVGNTKDVMIDKKNHVAYNVNYVNDYLGDVKSWLTVQDGYYWSDFEPIQLAEILEDAIKSDSISETQREYLETILDELNEDDNDVLLLGKLKL